LVARHQRWDRGNRWVFAAFGVISLAGGFLPGPEAEVLGWETSTDETRILVKSYGTKLAGYVSSEENFNTG